MTNKPVAYTGFFLVVTGFLGIVGVFVFGNQVAWLRDCREAAAWGAFAICFLGTLLGLVNYRTAPGKVAAAFGGAVIVLMLLWLLMAWRPQRNNLEGGGPKIRITHHQPSPKT
jgi:drug/metabolite transporter superfamily protein YnfA